jgi:hypothetical protein
LNLPEKDTHSKVDFHILGIDKIAIAYYYFAMSIEKEERIERLCSGFALLEEKDQEYIFGVLQALLFAKRKTEKEIVAPAPLIEAEKTDLA